MESLEAVIKDFIGWWLEFNYTANALSNQLLLFRLVLIGVSVEIFLHSLCHAVMKQKGTSLTAKKYMKSIRRFTAWKSGVALVLICLQYLSNEDFLGYYGTARMIDIFFGYSLLLLGVSVVVVTKRKTLREVSEDKSKSNHNPGSKHD